MNGPKTGAALLACAALAIILFLSPARADEVEDAVALASASLHSGDISDTVQMIDLARKLVLLQKCEKLKAFMPKAPPGWKLEDIFTFAGNGADITCCYTKRGAMISVSVHTGVPKPEDTPANRAWAKKREEMPVVEIGRFKAGFLSGYNGANASLIMEAGNIIVIADGPAVSREELVGLVKGVDIEGIAALK